MADFLKSLPDAITLIWNTVTNKWMALILILGSLAAEHILYYLLLRKSKIIDSVEDFNNFKTHFRKVLTFQYVILIPAIFIIFLDLGRISEVLGLGAVMYATNIANLTIGTITNLKKQDL